MTTYVALIAGVTGAIGSALARQLGPQDQWKVYGISRNPPTAPVEGVTYISMDMTQRQSCVDVLSSYSDITHVFYSGRATHGEQMLESAEDNLLLLDNLLHGVESAGDDLQHVHLVQGGKEERVEGHLVRESSYGNAYLEIVSSIYEAPLQAEVDGWNFNIRKQKNLARNPESGNLETIELEGCGWIDQSKGILVYKLWNPDRRIELDLPEG